VEWRTNSNSGFKDARFQTHVSHPHHLGGVAVLQVALDNGVLLLLASGALSVLLIGCTLPWASDGTPGTWNPGVTWLGKGAHGQSCPRGYIPYTGHLSKGETLIDDGKTDTMEECGQRCDERPDCLSIEFSPTERLCIVNNMGGQPEEERVRDYQFCEKPLAPSIKDLLLKPEECVQREDAQIKLVAVSGSMWWVQATSSG